jgi:hypothetical protein
MALKGRNRHPSMTTRTRQHPSAFAYQLPVILDHSVLSSGPKSTLRQQANGIAGYGTIIHPDKLLGEHLLSPV